MDTEKNPDLSEIIGSLMQNPQISEIISSLKGGEAAAKPKESDTSSDKGESSPLGDISIPPELLASLPQMMQALSGLGLGSAQAKDSEKASENKPVPLKNGNRTALLSALKPYLSDKRCAVIDSLLQFEGLAGVLSSFNNIK